MHKKFWSENLKAGDHAADVSVDGKIILKWILEKYGRSFGLDSSGSGLRPVAGSLLHNNEHLISIKVGNLLTNE
jgi:hypothetical protein